MASLECKEIIEWIKRNGNPKNVEGMGRFGISTKNTFGVSIPALRKKAGQIGKNQQLSLELWESGVHEARLLAGFIGDAEKLTEKQMESWVRDFDSWDICDQICSNLFDKTAFAYDKAIEWTSRKEEFVKRAGFVLMASLSVHDKNAKNKTFERFLPIIKRETDDERNFVKKAVNWALRQIGKRNFSLNAAAIKTAEEILKKESKSARWIACDALRELRNEKTKGILAKKNKKE